MKISIISVGKVRSQPLAELEQEYLRRLQGRFAVARQVVRSDKELIERLAEQPGAITLLDEHGQTQTSTELATWLDRTLQEFGALTFVIGGPDGLPAEVRSRASQVLALSELTLPHEFALVLLLEQLFRAQSILTGHPYHRA